MDDVLVLRSYLQVVAWLCLSVVHCVLFHPHERGVGVGLGIRIAITKNTQFLVVLHQFFGLFSELFYLFLALTVLLLLFLGLWRRLILKATVQFIGYKHQIGRCKSLSAFLLGVLLCDVLVNLFKKCLYLADEFFPILLCRFAPDERVLVGFGFNLGAIDVFYVKRDKPLLGELYYQLCET